MFIFVKLILSGFYVFGAPVATDTVEATETAEAVGRGALGN